MPLKTGIPVLQGGEDVNGWQEFVDGSPVECRGDYVFRVTSGDPPKHRYFIAPTYRREEVIPKKLKPVEWTALAERMPPASDGRLVIIYDQLRSNSSVVPAQSLYPEWFAVYGVQQPEDCKNATHWAPLPEQDDTISSISADVFHDLHMKAVVHMDKSSDPIERMWWLGYMSGLQWARGVTNVASYADIHKRRIAGAQGQFSYSAYRAYSHGYRYGCEGRWVYPPTWYVEEER